HAVEALAVVVDDPPGIAQVVFPPLEQALIDVALVELGVADERHHAALGDILACPALGADIILDHRSEGGKGNAETHRAGRDVDVVTVLGARWVGLRAAEAAEVLELVEALLAEQI